MASNNYEKDDTFKTRANIRDLGDRPKLPRRAKALNNPQQEPSSTSDTAPNKDSEDAGCKEIAIDATPLTARTSDEHWQRVPLKSKRNPSMKEIKSQSDNTFNLNVTQTSNSFDALSSVSDEEDETNFADANDIVVQHVEDENTSEHVELTSDILNNNPTPLISQISNQSSVQTMSKIVKFNCPILDGSNYNSWKIYMEFSLEQNELWIDPATTLNVINANEALKLMNKRAAMFMAGYLEPKIIELLEFPRCFIQSWQRIKDIYDSKNVGDIAMLYGQIMSLKPSPDRSIHDHITDFETIFSKLRERGKPLDETMKVNFLLGSLRSDPLYSEVSRTAKWQSEKDLSFKKLRTVLIDINNQIQFQNNHDNSAFEVMSKVASNDHRPSSSGYKSNRPRGDNKSSNPSKPHARVRTRTERMNFTNCLKSSEIKENGLRIESVFSCTPTNSLSNWIIDSGASIHMCRNKSLFENLKASSSNFVRIANGAKIPILGYGNVTLKLSTQPDNFTLKLSNVAYVPNLDINLISVRCLSKEYGKVTFTDQACTIESQSISVQIGKVMSFQYILDNNNSSSSIQANLCVHEWHKRLAHRCLDKIKRLKDFGLIISKCNCSNDCEGCLKGKMSTLPFPPISEKPTKVLELGGGNYFLTMIDVFSDYTEVFIMSKKSEAKSHIMNYITKMENLLNKKPKIFRTDRGGEFMDHELQSFLSSKGIQFQCTVHDSPQQGGLAERKNRTLVEAMRTMLHSKNIQMN